MRPWSCRQVPEVGIERLIAGDAYESHQFTAVGFQDAEIPVAPFQSSSPAFCRRRCFAAGGQQAVDRLSRRGVVAVQFKAPGQNGGWRLLTKGEKGHLAGIPHAGSDAVDGEQGPPQQFTAAVGAAIGCA